MGNASSLVWEDRDAQALFGRLIEQGPACGR